MWWMAQIVERCKITLTMIWGSCLSLFKTGNHKTGVNSRSKPGAGGNRLRREGASWEKQGNQKPWRVTKKVCPSLWFLLNIKKWFERKIVLSLFEGALLVLLSLEGSALPAGSLVAQVVTTGPPGRYVLLLANCHHRHQPYVITVVATCHSWTTNIMMHTLFLCLVPCALVLAAPNNPRIGPENEKDLEQVQAATTCQTAILRWNHIVRQRGTLLISQHQRRNEAIR